MRKKAFQAAFPYTIPIFAGFWFLALAYGIYMNANGFPFVYPMLMSLLIYGGSLEFVAVEMLLSSFAPMQVFIMALLIQARHIFYGISMLDRFKGMGWKKFYLIFGMCDETFSVNYTADIPEDVDRGWFMFFVTLLNQLYWVSGATVGGLVGSLLRFDTTGISFVMTAMFVVIFLEQWLKEDNHISSLVGVAAAVVCRICFGADSFMLPTMAVIVLLLAASRKRLGQHRTIVPASLSRLFATLLQFEKWEIHTVFLHFSNFELEQKSWLSLLVKLCGVALEAMEAAK